MLTRLLGALRLRAKTYDEISEDPTATAQAALVVVAAALAGAIGALGDGGTFAFGVEVAVTVIGWIIFAACASFVGNGPLAAPETNAGLGEVLRPLGFAHVPGLLVLGGYFLPEIERGLSVFAGIWTIRAIVVALRQALAMSAWRAIATALVAAVLTVIVAFVILLPIFLVAVAVLG